MGVVELLKALEDAIDDAQNKKEVMDSLNLQAHKAGVSYNDAVTKVQTIHKELQQKVSELGFTLGNPTGISEFPAGE